jgi:outer membrane receptor protein involved in Fe transport
VIGGIVKGNRLPSVAEFQMAASATYSWPVTLAGNRAEGFVSTTLQHIGDRYTQPSDQLPGAGIFVSNLPYAGATGAEQTILDLQLDAYTILNLSGGLDFDTWSLIGYINNLTDENADLALDRERGGRARLGFHTNQPRTVGVTARFRF